MADKIRLATEGAQDEIAAQINALTNAVSGSGSTTAEGDFSSKNLVTESGARDTANAIANLTNAASTKLADVVLINSAQEIAGQKTFSSTIIGDLEGNVAGNITGNFTGNVSGNLVGNVSGTASAALRLSNASAAYNVGNVSTPVYFANGIPVAANVVAPEAKTMVDGNGAITAGNASWGVYFDAGVPVTLSSMAATSAERLVDANGSNLSAGNSAWPVYISNGVPAAVSSLVANSATNATQLSSSAGNSIQPVYFTGGKPAAVANIVAGNYAVFGNSATAHENGAIAIGYNANAYTDRTIAIGKNAKSNIADGIAIGSNAFAVKNANTIAIGNGANASYPNSIAIGAGAKTSAANHIVIGDLSFPTKDFGSATSWSDLAANDSYAGKTMTATYDGWFVAYFHSMKSGGAYGYIYDSSINSTIYRARHDADAGYWGTDGEILWLPVRAGDSVYMYVKYGYFSDIYNVKGSRSV